MNLVITFSVSCISSGDFDITFKATWEGIGVKPANILSSHKQLSAVATTVH